MAMNTQSVGHHGILAFLPHAARGLPEVVRHALASKSTSVQVAMCILVLGGLLRTAAFMADRSFFADEAALAHNIVSRSFSDLAKPLDESQGAPLGYLIVVKTIVLAAGMNEYALRAWSWVTALASLALFGALARRWLSLRASVLACAIFALCPSLVFFAGEGKQYSSDVLVTTALLYAWARVSEATTIKRVLILGVVGLLATWLSHPAVFVLASIGAILVVKAVRTKEVRLIVTVASVGSVWLASMAFLYLLTVRGLASNQVLLDYWNDSFMPLSVFGALKWLWYSYWEMMKDHFGGYGEPAGFIVGWLFAVGVIGLSVARSSRSFGWLVLGPLLFAVLASAARYYPFGGDGGRLLLFTIPLIILGATAGWSMVCADRGWVVPATLTCVMLLPLGRLAIKQGQSGIASGHDREELRPLMERMRQEARPGDHVYVFQGARVAFSLYANEFGYLSGRQLQLHEGHLSFFDNHVQPAEFESELQPLRGSGRVWVVVSHGFSRTITDEEAVLSAARKYGSELASYRERGAGVYLFDFPPDVVRRSMHPEP
jgi:hypothetical protein